MIDNSFKINTSNTVLKIFVKKALAFKYVYIGSLAILLLATYIINKYSTNIYQTQAKILLHKDNETNDIEKIFRSTTPFKSGSDIENEITMLKSYSLITSTISALNLEAGYFMEEKNFLYKSLLYKSIFELYDDFPYEVLFDKSHNQPLDLPLYIEALSDSTYRIRASNDKTTYLINYVDNQIDGEVNNIKLNEVYRFNETVTTNYFKFSVSLKNKEDLSWLLNYESKMYFQFFYYDYLVNSSLNNLSIEPLSDMASIVLVSFKGQNKTKINDFLNKYLQIYLENSLSRRNKIAQSTIDFIDNQISEISDSLKNTESKLRDYRSSNQVVDMSFQGQRIFDQMTQIETQRANMVTQKRYYTYIIDYLKEKNNDSNPVLPSSSNVVDPILNQLISELTKYNSEKQDIINDSKKNIFLPQIENKIEKQKETILENVTNNLNTLNISINELDYRYNKLSGEISKLPKTELRLVGINREYKLNDAIYTYLLQRKAEAQISKASNLPDGEITEPARSTFSYVIYPKKRLNYIIALFFGLMLPTIFILLRDFFNDKITNEYQLEHIVGRQLIGVIYKNKYKNPNIVTYKPNSYIAESFRTLRTHLLVQTGKETSKTILLTSSIPQEGKSFISLNLATSISLLGYKTILIDCDLRRPSLHSRLNIENTLGLSNYLTGKAVLEDITIPLSNSFDFICAGSSPPNPSELLESTRCSNLFQVLRNNYQFIIIDSPPVGAISDSLLLMKYAQYTIFVARNNYTKKDIVYNIKNQLFKNNDDSIYVVLNDVEFNKTDYGGYYKKYYTSDNKA